MSAVESADLVRLTNAWPTWLGPESGLAARPPLTPPSKGGETEAGSPVFHPPLTKGGQGGSARATQEGSARAGQGGFARVDAMQASSALVGHEAIVAARFDALHARFKPEVADDDPRLLGIMASLGPLRGRRILDLGCGKGRFARILAARGARVVGLDVSAAMLTAAGGAGLDRVMGSVRRLPFRERSFDAAIAVEVFEHLEPRALDDACVELLRVLRPGGLFVLVDKNLYAMNARRPWLPALAVKWLDQHRGLWMYPAGGPVRERWFRPAGMRRRLSRWFPEVRVRHLLSREEAGRFPFQTVPSARLFVLWAARSPGGPA